MRWTSKTLALLMAVGIALISLMTSVIAVGGAAAAPVKVAAPCCSTGTAVLYRGAWYCPELPWGFTTTPTASGRAWC
jgi:hypothetical protein